MTNDLKPKLEKALASLKRSEKITKEKLSEMSRDLLYYVPESQDIGMVNRVLAVLTPMNKKTATLYFNHFLEWKLEEDGKFSSKLKGDKTIAKFVELRKDFLYAEQNDIWTWAEEHVKVEPKPVDYAKNITRNVHKALEDEVNPLTAFDIMKAVMAGGVTPEDLLKASLEVKKQEALAKEQEEQLENLAA